MEIIKGLFFISMAVSLCTSEPKLLDPHGFRLPPRQSEVVRPTNYDCYCPTFNSHSVQISSLLGDNLADLERVVVYFYKNKATNKLIMYTPGKEKQRQIPDTPYDAGDNLLTIGTETIVELYDNFLHTMSQLHLNSKTLSPTNSHRLIDYITSSENIPMKPAPAIDITDQYFSYNYIIPRPNPDVNWGQLDQHDNQDYNENLQSENKLESIGMIPGGVIYPYIDEIIKNSHKSKQPSYNFTHWFEEQLKLLPEMTYLSNEFIDVYTLKTRIVRILREHGLNLVDDFIRDQLGYYFDMTKLQILKITIDEIVTNVREEWSPVHIEALMLVYLNPLHILGVIPLKTSHLITSLPTVAQRIGPDEKSTESGFVYGTDIPATNGPLDELLDNDKSLEPSSSVRYNDVLESDISHESSNNSRSLKEENTTQVHELVEDIIRTFGKYYNSDMISQVVKHLSNEPNRTLDEDVPQYRIIGGHAALQSGTPLNNKARSGYEGVV